MTLSTHTFAAMTTPCQLTLYGGSATLPQQIEAEVQRLETKYNFHAANSWLNRTINQRRGHQVILDTETRRILQQVRTLSEWSGGVFDITVGTLTVLCSETDTNRYQARRAALQPYMGLAAWSLEDDVLRFADAATQIDLGGVIKEYAVDRAIQLAMADGATAGLANFGGDLRAFGTPPDADCFTIGIEHPHAPATVLFGLTIADQALASSGHHARRKQVAGCDRSHIEATARADLPPWLQSSVIAPDTLTAGVLATALLIEPTLPLPAGCTAVLVDAELKLHPRTESS
ncbi:FAD:protein FMN transferase [Chitinivorax sp. B]|uniref:FAD:protein FMN transferase n=1 Tax=Chitinivorax sp. B TaxID=2502235 RepID=UPI0010F7F000|nr:FAD:protein FMN transferase [Chitinivorax sp. B]